MVDRLHVRFRGLSLRRIYEASCHSRSQVYKWRGAATLDRKERSPKELEEEVLENSAGVVAMFPHCPFHVPYGMSSKAVFRRTS